MKALVALALAFFLVTAGFTVTSDLVHHVPEPTAELPGAPKPKVKPLHASVKADTGSTSVSNVADGRSAAAKLIEVSGSGAAAVAVEDRALKVRAESNGNDGRSIWFALVGSDIKVSSGALPTATMTVRMDGIAWKGLLRSDGGDAVVQLVLQVQDEKGTVLGTAPILEDKLIMTGSKELAGSNVSASVDVDVKAPATVTAILYAKAEAQGGGGTTTVDLGPSAQDPSFGASYQSVTVAVGTAPPPTTIPVAGAGYTLAQVAEHNVQADCWLAIGGRVYDASPYLRKHPGGYWMVIPVCGTDATKAFETQGQRGSRHSYEAIDKLKKLDIGAFLG